MRLPWKRNSEDPLATLFFNKYRLNLLSIPRQKASICDVYLGDFNGKQKLLSSPGSAISFLDPKFEIPEIILDDKMTDVNDTVSDALSANVGLDFLEGFLNVLGGASYGTKVRAKYEQKRTHLIKLRFDSPTQDRVDRYLLGDNLIGHKIKVGNPAIIPGRKYYIVIAVARSPSISMTAEGQNQQKIDAHGEVAQVASSSVSIAKESSREGELTFRGDTKLAFGVELSELAYDTQNQQFRLDPVTEPFRVRGEDTERTRKVIKSAFIGDANEGDMFVDID